MRIKKIKLLPKLQQTTFIMIIKSMISYGSIVCQKKTVTDMRN